MLPTKTGEGTPATDSSTGSATSADLKAGEKDLTLDFGFVPPAVKVGNYVWLDADHNGLQDEGEKGIQGVKLTLVGPDGQPVKDVTGAEVAPVTTDADGHYEFVLLPVLTEGQT